MKLVNVFKKTRIAVGRKNYITFTRRPEVPEGLLRKCNKCGGAIIAEDVKKDHYICPKCGGYFRVHARRRIEMITDEGSFEEWDSDLQGGNPLEYKGYEEKLKKLKFNGTIHKNEPLTDIIEKICISLDLNEKQENNNIILF